MCIRDSHNRIAVELIAKGLLRGQELCISKRAGILGKDWCSCKSKKVIFFEIFDDSSVHIPKLAAVTLVENNHNMLVKHCVTFIPFDKSGELLNRCNDNFIFMGISLFAPILQLTL